MALREALLAVALLLLALAASAHGALIAGATSAINLERSVLAHYSNSWRIGAYVQVGSGSGINAFLKKTVLAGFSDVPMTYAQDRAAGKRFTIVQGVSGYSFVVSGSRTVRLTAAQIYAIYAGRITNWAQIRGSGKFGVIIPVARSIASGTTGVITKWLQLSRSGIPYNQVGMGPWRAGSRHTVYLGSSQAVASYVQGNRQAIGYVQTGIGARYATFEVAVQNYATKQFMTARGANLVRVVPGNLPLAVGSWVGVPGQLLNSRFGYPIVSFLHVFLRPLYGSSTQVIKPFMLFLMTQEAQSLAAAAGFQAIPGYVKGNNLLAIGQIKP